MGEISRESLWLDCSIIVQRCVSHLGLTDDQYAILDECTSAVTLEIEKVMYDHATGESIPV